MAIPSEIKVKLSGVETAVQTLRIIQSECEENNSVSFNLEGDGAAASALREILTSYEALGSVLSELVSNTITILDNIRSSIEAMDQATANLFENADSQTAP